MERLDFEQWKPREVARLLALVEAERRYYQEIVASLPVALVILASDRSIAATNRAFRQMFGVRAEDLRGRTIEQILDSERLVEKIRDAMSGGASQPGFFQEINQRKLRITITPIRNWEDDAAPETLLAIEDLAGSETAARPAVLTPARPVAPAAGRPPAHVGEDLPAVIWQADAATLAFTAVRGAAEALLGHPISHWLETREFFSGRMHPEDRDATLEFYEAALARGGEASAEYRAITATGAAAWCRETIRVPAPGQSQGQRIVTGVLTGIGQRKQIEEQLLAAERIAALQSLAGRLAHDLNNPLMIITGYAEEMLHGLPEDDPKHGDVAQILAATQRISALTGQLVEFTRRHADAAEAVNLSAIVGRMEEKIALAAGESVAVEITAGKPVWGFAGGAQLEQVILALVASAKEDARKRTRVIVACDKATITERVSRSTLAPGRYARITVRDDSRGVDAAKKASIFEAFLTKDAGKTAGSDLAHAYALVRGWGGDISFRGEPSRGSAFFVYVPHFEPPSSTRTAEILTAPKTRRSAAVAVEPPRKTILVVDDEADIRALLTKILRRERYQVFEAASAEEALALASRSATALDLLLTDVMLPGMQGRELAERLFAASPGLKVLYVSGYSDDEAVRTGGFPQGSKFLQKPFTLGALVRKVREALGE